MARLHITESDIEIFNIKDDWVATDWEVYDKIYNNGTLGIKLFESLNNTINRKNIIATLRYPNGKLYPPEKGSIARVRVRFGNTYSNWITKPCTKELIRLPYTLPYQIP